MANPSFLGPNSAATASASCEYLLPLRGIFLIKGPSSRHTEGFTERFPFSALVCFLAETHAQKQGGKTSWTTLRLKYLSENCTLYCTHTVPNPSDEPCVPSHGEEAALGISQQPRGGVELQDPGGRKKPRCTFRGHYVELYLPASSRRILSLSMIVLSLWAMVSTVQSLNSERMVA